MEILREIRGDIDDLFQQIDQSFGGLDGDVQQIRTDINALLKGQDQLTVDVTNLEKAVAETAQKEEGAEALIQQLAKNLQEVTEAAQGNPKIEAAIAAATNTLTEANAKLGEVIQQDTPPTEPPTEPPAPAPEEVTPPVDEEPHNNS